MGRTPGSGPGNPGSSPGLPVRGHTSSEERPAVVPARDAAPVRERHEILYALDDAIVMIPYERIGPNASKARYEGWRELHSMGMVDSPFNPIYVTAHVRWMFRYTDNPWAELTHKYGDAMTPGAYKVWSVEVDPAWA